VAEKDHPYLVDGLELAGLKLDRDCQPRVLISEALVREYAQDMQNGSVFPHIIVFFDGADHWLADGFHRFHAARSLKLTHFPAEIHTGTRREAILHSVGANATFGARRSNEDKRRAVQTLLGDPEWSKWADRAIARQCGVDHVFVGDLRKRSSLVTNTSDESLPSSRERKYTNKHGVEATMNVESINASRRRPAEVVQITPDVPRGTPGPTPKRLAVEAALKKDPLANSEVIAAAVGCSQGFVAEVRGQIGVQSPKTLYSSSAEVRAKRFDQATLALETYGEHIAEAGVEDFAHDPRVGKWLERLSVAIAGLRRVRIILEDARAQLSEVREEQA
jgi:hypothetical protein